MFPLRLFLIEAQFTIRTDQGSLRWILHLSGSTGKLARRRLRLSKFEFDVLQFAVVKLQAAVAPSGLETTGENDTPLENDLHLLANEVDSDKTNLLVIYANSNDFIPPEAQEKTSTNTTRTLEWLVV